MQDRDKSVYFSLPALSLLWGEQNLVLPRTSAAVSVFSGWPRSHQLQHCSHMLRNQHDEALGYSQTIYYALLSFLSPLVSVNQHSFPQIRAGILPQKQYPALGPWWVHTAPHHHRHFHRDQFWSHWHHRRAKATPLKLVAWVLSWHKSPPLSYMSYVCRAAELHQDEGWSRVITLELLA